MKNDTASGVFKKLRLENKVALIVNAPETFSQWLKTIPHDTKPTGKKDSYDFVQIFATSQNELEQLAKSVREFGKYDCIFWACYPKGTGPVKSDIKRETVWKAFELIGLQAVSQVAIDETWSALRGRPAEKVGK